MNEIKAEYIIHHGLLEDLRLKIKSNHLNSNILSLICYLFGYT